MRSHYLIVALSVIFLIVLASYLVRRRSNRCTVTIHPYGDDSDMTPVINEAINKVQSKGGTICFERGMYIVGEANPKPEPAKPPEPAKKP